MTRLLLIGIGPGGPDELTVRAAHALDAVDVLFVVTKDGIDELVALRRAVVARHRTTGPLRTVEIADPPRPWRTAPDYRTAVARWREERAERWEEALAGALGDGATGAFLVWGDPSLYESTLAVVRAIAARGRVDLDVEVVPGVSSLHALTAAHGIPLNRVGCAVRVAPARLVVRDRLVPAADEDLVVVLDAHRALAALPDGAAVDVYWGAYVGTPDEVLVAGPLAEVRAEITRRRDEARARKGWIFDIALLRPTSSA